MNKFIPQYEPNIKQFYIDAAKNQMATGWIGTSITTDEFEKRIKLLTGRKHAISTTSGTMALFLGMESLDKTDRWAKPIIFYPTYTFLAGANVLKYLEYDIHFIDINLETMCMDVDKLEKAFDNYGIDGAIFAVFFVTHNAYNGPDIQRAKNLAKKYKCAFIEDSAQSIGIQNAGTYGDFSIFSFSVPKLITTGQGGVLLTDDDGLAERAKQLRDHGDNWRKDKYHKHIGLNLKFNDIAAAIGIAQLDNINGLLAKRKKIFDSYRKHLNVIDFGYDSTWMVIYKTDKIEQIIEALNLENIQAVQYYRPIPDNPPFQNQKCNDYSNAKYVYDHYLYLPSSLTLKKSDINRICKIIKKVDNE